MSLSFPAFILAAGRGERMRPLTDSTPKPLLEVGGKPLLAWHLDKLIQADVPHVVINTAWLGHQIEQTFGSHYGTGQTPIFYSREEKDFGHALETAGGIARALPLLQKDSRYPIFWCISSDAFMPVFVFDEDTEDRFIKSKALAHIWLVKNPPHHLQGDFAYADGHAIDSTNNDALPRYTFSGVGLYHASLFLEPWLDVPFGNPDGISLPLAVPLRKAMQTNLITAEIYDDVWLDVGTPERLRIAQQLIQTR